MSWLDDLAEDKDLANQEGQLALLPQRQLGTFHGFWGATAEGVPRGLLEGTAAAVKYGTRYAGEVAGGANSRFMNRDAEAVSATADPGEEASQALLETAQEFRPDEGTGAAGQIGNEITAIIPRTVLGTIGAGPLGGAVAAGAPVIDSESMRLQQEGIDQATADRVGLLTGITTGAGALIPGSQAFKTVTGKLASTVGGNVAFGGVQRYGTHEILDEGGYAAQAEQYRVLDGKAALADATLGLFFLGADLGAGAISKRITGEQLDDALATRQEHHAKIDTAPGVPATPAAAAAHTARLDAAIKQALRGEKVNVADIAGEGVFVAPPAATRATPATLATPDPVGTRDSALGLILGLETSGNANAKNPLSSATGLGQFTDATWLATIAKHRPDLAAGQSKSAILALRNDGALSVEMTGHLLDDNNAQLAAAGVELTPMTGYLAHHFGAGRVKKLLANRDALMDQMLSPKELDANPTYRGKTVAQVMAKFEARAAKKGIKVQATESPSVAAVLPEMPQTFIRPRTGTEAADVIDRTLAEVDTIAATALPPARVKSLETELDKIAVRLRTNDATERQGIVRADPRSKITPDQRAEMAARQTEIKAELEAHRTAIAQLRRGEDLRTKLSKIDLDSDLIALSETLSPSVRRPSNARPAKASAKQSGAKLPVNETAPKAALPDTPIQEGAPPVASTVARSNVTPIRKPSASAADLPEVQNVRTVADASPGMAVVAGNDADGNAVYGSLADVLDEIEADHQQQVREADAYEAAFACFLRRG